MSQAVCPPPCTRLASPRSRAFRPTPSSRRRMPRSCRSRSWHAYQTPCIRHISPLTDASTAHDQANRPVDHASRAHARAGHTRTGVIEAAALPGEDRMSCPCRIRPNPACPARLSPPDRTAGRRRHPTAHSAPRPLRCQTDVGRDYPRAPNTARSTAARSTGPIR